MSDDEYDEKSAGGSGLNERNLMISVYFALVCNAGADTLLLIPHPKLSLRRSPSLHTTPF
jgi:hypothetical protein